MASSYPISKPTATDNFTLPKKMIDWINSHSEYQKELIRKDYKILGKRMFYETYKDLTAYKIFINEYTLEQLQAIKSRTKFWEYYHDKNWI